MTRYDMINTSGTNNNNNNNNNKGFVPFTKPSRSADKVSDNIFSRKV